MLNHIKILLPVLCVAIVFLAGCSNFQAQNDTSAHFWDEIPMSPSTTVPEEIKDDYWHGQFQRVNREIALSDKSQIVFFGDSITWLWSLGNKTGYHIWKERYLPYSPVNMGNSGDITPVMLYRVTHGNLDFAENHNPKVAVLLCGTNNFVVTQSDGGNVHWDLGADCPPSEAADGARAIAQVFRRRLPHTRVIMMGILPVASKAKWAKCEKVNSINAALQYNKNEVIYLDLQDEFLLDDGSINPEFFTDGTHLTPQGYKVWADSIDPIISSTMVSEPLNPVKIMNIGGSITEGFDSSTSYRRYLDGMLRRKGNLIDFTGSRKKHNNNKKEPDNYQYDVDHEGHWGKNSKWLTENMPGLLEGDVPNIAVIYTGTEDIINDSAAAESLTDDILVNIDKIIGTLRSKNENMKIVLAKILPVRGKEAEVSLLNSKISRYAKTYSSTSSPLLTVDLYNGFDVNKDITGDGMLPNSVGAKKMAKAIADVINNMIN